MDTGKGDGKGKGKGKGKDGGVEADSVGSFVQGKKGDKGKGKGKDKGKGKKGLGGSLRRVFSI